MSATDLGFNATYPISAWNKPLKADFKKLFVSLAKITKDAFQQKWPEVGVDLIEASTAVGLATSPAELSWVLIRRAMAQAMLDLLKDSLLSASPRKDPPSNEAFCDRIDLSLEAKTLLIDEAFFRNPGSLSIVADLQVPFRQWLEFGYEVPTKSAEAIAARLPAYFTFALWQEWARNPVGYSKIEESIKTPFNEAAAYERSWIQYSARLVRQINEPVFNEAFSLAQIYVPLRAYWTRPVDEKDGPSGAAQLGRESKVVKHAVFLEEMLNEWIDAADRSDAIRLISGGPGSGKSSFAKTFAAKQAQRTTLRTLMVPLHQFKVEGSVVRAMAEFVGGILTGNPLDPERQEKRLLVIFDGLDELQLMGGFGADVARDFVHLVATEVRKRNHTDLRLAVIITGRVTVMQSAEKDFVEPGQVLHMLPYYLAESERTQYSDEKKILKPDQRDLWWKNYGTLTGRKHEGLPKEIKRRDMDDVTREPLLNYLVSLALLGKMTFTADFNLNTLYEHLFAEVHRRAYEQRKHIGGGPLDLNQFRIVMEEVAVSAWHGNGRTTTVRDIENHCKEAGISALLEQLAHKAESGVTRLLTAFYFRQFGTEPSGHKVFEFTHKSFREYLTATRIVRQVELIEEEMARREKRPGSGMDDSGALTAWAKLAGPTPLDMDLVTFLRREISLRGSEQTRPWQKRYATLIASMLATGMPMEKIGGLSYGEMSRRARNAEEALLTVLDGCSRTTEKISMVEWPVDAAMHGDNADATTTFGTWFKRLTGQRRNGGNNVSMGCVSRLHLQGAVLFLADFWRADCTGTDFAGLQASFCNFGRSSLCDTNFEGGGLEGAIFSEANLERTNFSAAHLKGANLEAAHLEGANIAQAILDRALLRRANLKGARLNRANLKGANLEGANLEGANLEGANFEGANLKGANLKGANLKGANLKGASLEGANLEGANLEGANLEGANLEEAIVKGTILAPGLPPSRSPESTAFDTANGPH